MFAYLGGEHAHGPAILALGWERKLSRRTTACKLVALLRVGLLPGPIRRTGVAALLSSCFLPTDASLSVLATILVHWSCQAPSALSSKLSAKKSTIFPLAMGILLTSTLICTTTRHSNAIISAWGNMYPPAYWSHGFQFFYQSLRISDNFIQGFWLQKGGIHNFKWRLF